MPSPKRLPGAEQLRRLAGEGRSKKEIAEKYGVSEEAVRMAGLRAGINWPSQRLSHAHYLPWSVQVDHSSDLLARRIRQYSKLQQGVELSDDDQRLLEKWMAWMDGENPYGTPLSVHYDRNDPDGFWLEPRREGDRDYISPPEEAVA